MNVLIINGHIIDLSQGIDGRGDVHIVDGKIKSIRLEKRDPQPLLQKKRIKMMQRTTGFEPLMQAAFWSFPALLICMST